MAREKLRVLVLERMGLGGRVKSPLLGVLSS